MRLGSYVERPRAILSVSAHWMTRGTEVSIDPEPVTIHDFGGFPPDLYAMHYPAPGAPDVGAAAANALQSAGLAVEVQTQRGYDHGTWVPLKLAYPDANISVAQMSVQPYENAEWHFKLGQALAPLRDDDVLIMASGSLTHNLSAFVRGSQAPAEPWALAFSDWVHDAVRDDRTQDLLDFETKAPNAAMNHPTTEHFLPLFVALGAATPGVSGERLHASMDGGVLAMDAYKFN
ncbi:MAG: dioxygenase [Rhodospirillaceae bacterium]|nr:dioxygenase [Rhodospirillaceae bacterium]